MAAGVLMTACGGDPVVPEAPDTDLKANITVKELLDMYAGGTYDYIDTALYVEAVVTGNDIGGSLYKTLYVQDPIGTENPAGLAMVVEMSTNHNKFPLGQTFIIDLKGLALGAYGGQRQLRRAGSPSETGRMYEADINEHFHRKGYASEDNIPEPLALSLKDANKIQYCGMLIRVDSVYWVDSGQYFADVYATFSGNAANHYLADYRGRSSNQLLVRISQYSLFATDILPGGCGSVVGVVGNYNGTAQLYLRDKSDVIGFPEVVLPEAEEETPQE